MAKRNMEEKDLQKVSGGNDGDVTIKKCLEEGKTVYRVIEPTGDSIAGTF